MRIYAWALSEVFHELSGHGIMGESEAAGRDPAKPEEKENPAGSGWGRLADDFRAGGAGEQFGGK